jgi:Arc/MetJ-type ribon-helix-helix transcriptional regulator
LAEQGTEEKDYEEVVVKLGVSKDYLRKLEQLIDVKRIFSSRAEAFRRSLELLFEKYEDALKESQ